MEEPTIIEDAEGTSTNILLCPTMRRSAIALLSPLRDRWNIRVLEEYFGLEGTSRKGASPVTSASVPSSASDSRLSKTKRENNNLLVPAHPVIKS